MGVHEELSPHPVGILGGDWHIPLTRATVYLSVDAFDGVVARAYVDQIRHVVMYVPRAAAIHAEGQGCRENGQSTRAFAFPLLGLAADQSSTPPLWSFGEQVNVTATSWKLGANAWRLH